MAMRMASAIAWQSYIQPPPHFHVHFFFHRPFRSYFPHSVSLFFFSTVPVCVLLFLFPTLFIPFPPSSVGDAVAFPDNGEKEIDRERPRKENKRRIRRRKINGARHHSTSATNQPILPPSFGCIHKAQAANKDPPALGSRRAEDNDDMQLI